MVFLVDQKVLSEEVSDIVEQEENSNPFTHQHNKSDDSDNHIGHSHTTNSAEQSHTEHNHTSPAHKAHTHHEHKESKHRNFWDVSKSTEHEEKKGFKQLLWDNRLIIVALIAIFLLGFGIRAHLLQYHYLFEFDAFYHARLVEQIVTVGHIVTPDPDVYYQVAGGIAAQPWSVYHYICAAIYELLAMGQPYNKELLMWVMQANPVLFGAIICVVMYFLGKEVFNSKKIGLITAFAAAVIPAFAYRTMAGAQGDNSFGFLWFVIGFIFLVRSVKNHSLDKSTLLNAALGGIFFGLMAMTWRMYLLIPLILIGYFIFAVILIASKQEDEPKDLKSNHAFAFSVKMFLAMAIFHVMTYAYGEDWISDALLAITNAIHLGTLTSIVLIVIACIAAFIISVFFIANTKKETKSIFPILVILGLYAVFFIMLFVFVTVPDIHDRTSIGAMVGEESNGNQFFGTKYNDLMIFPWIALIFLPISLYLLKRDDAHTSIIFFFWTIITLFMAWYTLKFTFVFGLAIASAIASAAFILFESLKKFNMDKGIEAKVIIGVFLIIVLLGVGASAKFFPDYVPFTDSSPEWKNAIAWIDNNTPADAKFFNWWDQGHILAFLTDRKYSTDNRNASGQANVALAKFVVTTDTNLAYQIASKEIGADYIILDSSMFQSAATFEYYVADKVDSSLIQKYYNGPINIIGCSTPDANATIVTCGSNQIPILQWNSISPTWKSVPDDFQNGSIPVFYYRVGGQLLVLNQVINNTNLAKVWMDSNETNKYYKTAYEANGIKILKITK